MYYFPIIQLDILLYLLYPHDDFIKVNISFISLQMKLPLNRFLNTLLNKTYIKVGPETDTCGQPSVIYLFFQVKVLSTIPPSFFHYCLLLKKKNSIVCSGKRKILYTHLK